ncbi:MAG: EAL domain-containing protein [Gammaproteobacteria bacterium]|nr:EAL domain-containing protein [Gammaproteobacteria bacterium]MDH3465048.1 EAL domain-containing protein [Gammaproteobacteria bacterium]
MVNNVTDLLTQQVARSIRHEQIRILYRQSSRGLVITALAITALCLVLVPGVEPRTLFAWWVAMQIVLAARYAFVHRFSAIEATDFDPDRWERGFVTGAAFTGLVWGFGGVLAGADTGMFYQAVIFMVVAAIVAAAISFLGSVFKAYASYMLAATLPLFVWCVLNWNLIYGVTSVFLLMMMWGMWKAMSNFHAVLVSALRSQYEKIDLAEQLEDANSQLQHDINEILRAEQAIRDSEERFRGIFEEGLVGMAVLSPDGKIQRTNRAFCVFLGYDPADLVGKSFMTLVHTENIQSISTRLQTLLDGTITGYQDEGRYIHHEGHDIYGLSALTALRDAQDRPYSVIVQVQDTTEERRMALELEYQARHDDLTGLVNRREFQRRVEIALDTARMSGGQHAICCVDLDQFKLVNDSVGHFAGDELLREVTGVVQQHIRRQDTLARIGGDEFGLLLEGCSLKKASDIAAQIALALRGFRFNWDDRSFEIRASIGVVAITPATQNAVELMKHADMACYTAKDQGGDGCYVYPSVDSMGVNTPEILQLTRWLDAFHEDRFALYAQPIRALANDCGDAQWYELLLRVIGDDGRALSPVTLIPAAERYGQMTRVDHWVIETALNWYRKTIAAGHAVRLSVNISGTSMADRTFAGFAREQIQQSTPAPGAICFEVTETAAIRNLKDAQRLIGELKEYGCRFALDDFGSGLSSFAYLKYLDVDYLKIDGGFVHDMARDPSDRATVAAINQIGLALGIETIAESIGSDEVVRDLRNLGVNYGQGYYFGLPVPLLTLHDDKAVAFQAAVIAG